ncbi:hypothetical protein SAMCFNEI73_Ch1845 [Sinorhizobium americanum]|uniref:Uncharacterized protein n=1 Tax=Sinorhizobium americanum TaxID=194963 RepID=A0A1L3LM37_9HYPH|nr:hypothetical protein SAMCFNEI73_Ch1845 [Sinorhizobium americanum]
MNVHPRPSLSCHVFGHPNLAPTLGNLKEGLDLGAKGEGQ